MLCREIIAVCSELLKQDKTVYVKRNTEGRSREHFCRGKTEDELELV